jgi:hypothetical protein
MKSRMTFLIAVTAAGLGLWLALVAAVSQAAAAPAPPAQTTVDGKALQEAAARAAAWLAATHQNDDGGYSSFSAGADIAPSDPAGTLDALLAMAGAHADLSAPLAYLEEHPDELAQYAAGEGSTAAKTVLGLQAAGSDPFNFGGQNFVISITEQLSPTGEFNVSSPYNQALAIHALNVVGEAVPAAAISWLLTRQAADGELAGSWDDGFGTAGNPDATALALMALNESGTPEASAAADRAVEFLAAAQLESGGWEFGPGFGENANSTALVIQALAHRGEDTLSVDGQWVRAGRSPAAALITWQADSGAFQADFGQGRQDDFFSTVQVVPALAAAATQAPPVAQPADTQPPEVSTEQTPEAAGTRPGAGQEEPPETAGQESPPGGGDSSLPFILLGVLVILVGGALIWFWNERRK